MNEQPKESTTDIALRNSEVPVTRENPSLRYVRAAVSDNTRRAYTSAIRHFERWGGKLPAKPVMIIDYLTHYAADLNPRTLSVRLAALRQWHRVQGFADPTGNEVVRKTLKGIRRKHGRPLRKAKAFSAEDLERLMAQLQQQDLTSARDRALLLVGFLGAFRRSELVCLRVADLKLEEDGYVVTLPRSKTDQSGEGISKGLPYLTEPLCPVAALQKWLDTANINEGPIFRGIDRWGKVKDKALNPDSVNSILKKVAGKAGLSCAPELSGHSLRRSLATSAYRAGAKFSAIKRQGGWKDDRTVSGYIEEAQQFEGNVGSVIFSKPNHDK